MTSKTIAVTLIAMLLVVPAPAAAQTGDSGGNGIVDGVADFVDGVVDGVANAVDTAVDAVGGAINTAGNAVNAVVAGERAKPSGAADLSADERQFLSNKTDDLEQLANNNPGSWNVKDNVTKYTKYQVVVSQNGKVLDKWKLRVNWSNKTINFTRGTWDNPDVTVYPAYRDVKFLANNYEGFVRGNVGASAGARVGAIWKTTPCEPNNACKTIRSEYGYFIDWMIGRLT